MAKEKNEDDKISELIKRNQDLLYADNYGISPSYFNLHKDSIKKITTDIKTISKNMSFGDSENGQKTLMFLGDLTYSSMSHKKEYDNALELIDKNTTSNGFRQIGYGIEERAESDLISFSTSNFSIYRNIVSEYRGVARLIPEIDRTVNMIVRDIMSTNEISKRSIFNVYKQSTNVFGKGYSLNPDANMTDEDQTLVSEINEKMNTIIEELDLENKIKEYIHTSLIEGAKPVIIYPYRDIFKMMKRQEDLNEFGSREDYTDEDILRVSNKNKKLTKDFNYYDMKSFENKGIEDIQFDKEQFSCEKDYLLDNFVKEIVGEEYSREYHRLSTMAIKERIEEMKNMEINSVPDSMLNLSDIDNKYKKMMDETNAKPKMNNLFNEQMYSAIKTIDDKIEIYDKDSSAMSLAIDSVKRILKHKAYHENPKTGVISKGGELRDDFKSSEPGFMDIVEEKENNSKPKPSDSIIPKDYERSLSDSILDILSEGKKENKNSIDDFLNDCLIKECDAEDVIPLIVSGNHVGYYVYEISPYTGNVESINKHNSNLTDMFINMGFGNDSALSPNNSTISSAATGFSTPLAYGSGVSGELPNMNNSGMGTSGLGGVLNGYGYDSNNSFNSRTELMKKIVFHVIEKKLKNNDIESDKNFKDAVMNIIRDGSIVNNKVKITYVPEKYMVYFSPRIDGNGIPHSVLDKLLFTCYLYISSIMNSALMKLTRSGTRDKISVNMGKTLSIGSSIRGIERSLTTRGLNVESAFSSLGRVLKVCGTNDTIIEPVFDGESLFRYEELQKANNGSVDDDYTTNLLNTIITCLNGPLSIVSGTDSDDLASVNASKNLEYRSEIIQRQQRFGKYVTKMLRIIALSKNIHKSYGDKFDIFDIQMTFSPPEYLNLRNSNDMFSLVESYIENIIKFQFGENDDDITRDAKTILKRKLLRVHMSNIDWDAYDKLTKESISEAKQELPNKIIDKTISEKVNNETIDLNKNDDGTSDTGDDYSY